jgi:hypothetical protein
VCIAKQSPVTGMVWLVIISLFVLGEVLELLSAARKVVHPKRVYCWG